MNLHSARGNHREGGAAEAQGAGNGPAGQVGGLPHLEGDGDNAEGAHEGGDAAIAQDAAGQRHRDEGPLGAHDLNDGFGYGFGRAGDIHGLGQQGSGQENQEIVFEEVGKAGHEVDFVRLIDVHLTGDRHHQGAGKHSQVDIESLHDHPHQQREGCNEANQADHVLHNFDSSCSVLWF